MWHFLGSSQDLFFSSYFLLWWQRPLTSTWLHSACVWRFGRQTTWPHATINYMGFWQAVQWVCRLKSRQAIVKGKPPPPLSPPFLLHGFVPGPRQLLCLPKGLDTVAQLAPTGPWHQPGAQPKQWHKTAKKTTNNRQLSQLSLFASSLAGPFHKEQSWDQKPKRTNLLFETTVAQGCCCNRHSHKCCNFLSLISHSLNINYKPLFKHLLFGRSLGWVDQDINWCVSAI